ncbi:hypothetical protein BDV33DRAFT_184663 [Aspergillus novoparasiticus]|uniref:Uncharacterized protein n=1 Tax=Aspergillus novoparasiticus TaxID=986946 RepID=A0A5N6E7Y9_9EURO|nr:hypothetical protein BDV33DRAFT_184663 [Aspergillus novoparasiticus]
MVEIDYRQVAVSTAALLCAGISLILWFLLISRGHPTHLVLLSQKLLFPLKSWCCF